MYATTLISYILKSILMPSYLETFYTIYLYLSKILLETGITQGKCKLNLEVDYKKGGESIY